MEQYTRILVPLDGSDLAECAVPYARLLVERLGLQLSFLRVIEPVPPEVVTTGAPVSLDQVVLDMQAEAQSYVDGVAEPLIQEGLSVSTAIREGDAATMIVAEAEAQPGTLIALSTHGRSGMSRWLLGSVADKVLHATSTPLLVVRPDRDATPAKTARIQNVVVPLDGSALAEQALPYAEELARAMPTTVALVRVIPSARAQYHTAEYVYMEYPFVEAEERGASGKQAAADYLSEVAQRFRQKGISPVEEIVREGSASSVLVDLASEVPEGLVVMTTQGRSGIGRWLLGSVADRVASHAGVPVLIIRPSRQDERSRQTPGP